MTPEIARKVIGQFRQRATAVTQVEGLTDREREVLELVMQGAREQELVAERVGCYDRRGEVAFAAYLREAACSFTDGGGVEIHARAGEWKTSRLAS